MKASVIRRVLTAAADLPAAQGRRVLAALLSNEPDDPMADLRAALRQDMKPIGDALLSASRAGDQAAMQAALRKISKEMPELMGDARATANALSAQLLSDLIADETTP